MAVTSDGREILMPSLFPPGVYLTFAGAGDTASARGQGPAFITQSTTAGVATVKWSFNDYVYLAGGRATWDNAVAGDSISMNVGAPASVVTPNATSTGNVTVSNGMVLPAAGGNTGTSNLVTAIPVPHTSAGLGAWVWVPSAWSPLGAWTPDLNLAPYPVTGTGQVTPTPAGYDGNVNWTFDLYVVPVSIANFVLNMPIYGTRQADLTLPAIKPQMVLPQWVLTANVTSAVIRTTPLVVTWSLCVARNSSN